MRTSPNSLVSVQGLASGLVLRSFSNLEASATRKAMTPTVVSVVGDSAD